MNALRELPSVSKLLNDPSLLTCRERFTQDEVAEAIRSELECVRERLVARESVPLDALVPAIAARLEASARPRLRSVLNATGIVLHTNLGRAPLHEAAARTAFDTTSPLAPGCW